MYYKAELRGQMGSTLLIRVPEVRVQISKRSPANLTDFLTLPGECHECVLPYPFQSFIIHRIIRYRPTVRTIENDTIRQSYPCI
jgi:hypothetical protein